MEGEGRGGDGGRHWGVVAIEAYRNSLEKPCWNIAMRKQVVKDQNWLSLDMANLEVNADAC